MLNRRMTMKMIASSVKTMPWLLDANSQIFAFLFVLVFGTQQKYPPWKDTFLLMMEA